MHNIALISEILCQIIGVINLNKIKSWNELKKSLRWVNVSFQSEADKIQTKHFSYKSKRT